MVVKKTSRGIARNIDGGKRLPQAPNFKDETLYKNRVILREGVYYLLPLFLLETRQDIIQPGLIKAYYYFIESSDNGNAPSP